jgi:hypothetical protein
MYENLPKLIAKDFTVEEIIEMCPESRGSRGTEIAPAGQVMTEEINFADLLGTQDAPTEVAPVAQPAAEPMALTSQSAQTVGDAFPSTMDPSEMASLMGTDGNLPG